MRLDYLNSYQTGAGLSELGSGALTSMRPEQPLSEHWALAPLRRTSEDMPIGPLCCAARRFELLDSSARPAVGRRIGVLVDRDRDG